MMNTMKSFFFFHQSCVFLQIIPQKIPEQQIWFKNYTKIWGLIFVCSRVDSETLWASLCQSQKMGDLGSVTTAQNNTFFVYFLFFFQFQTSLQHIWQWWTQWDGGSRGSLLKEQLWLSWKMSMQTTGGMLCKDLQALCNACTKWSHLVMEQLWGNEGCSWTQ